MKLLRGIVIAFAFAALTACGDLIPELDPPGPRGEGTLTVIVNGLPNQANAAITVSGPHEYSRRITATSTLRNLVTGNYVINAESVVVNGDTFSATVSPSPVQVTESRTAEAVVTYTNVGNIGAHEIAPGVSRSGTVAAGSFDDYAFSGEFNVPLRFAFAARGGIYPLTLDVTIYSAEDTDYRNPLHTQRLNLRYAQNVDYTPQSDGDFIFRISGITETINYDVEARFLSGTPEERVQVTTLNPGEWQKGTIVAGSFDDYAFSGEFNVPLRFAFAARGGIYPLTLDVTIYSAEDTDYWNPLHTQRLNLRYAQNVDYTPQLDGDFIFRISGITETFNYDVEASRL